MLIMLPPETYQGWGAATPRPRQTRWPPPATAQPFHPRTGSQHHPEHGVQKRNRRGVRQRNERDRGKHQRHAQRAKTGAPNMQPPAGCIDLGAHYGSHRHQCHQCKHKPPLGDLDGVQRRPKRIGPQHLGRQHRARNKNRGQQHKRNCGGGVLGAVFCVHDCWVSHVMRAGKGEYVFPKLHQSPKGAV